MRARRWLGLVLPVASILTLMPADASADGGAYIDLDRTHFLVGSTGHAETYVSVPASKQDLFERGPFYLFVTPLRSPVIEGKPLPGEAVRLATMTVERDRGSAFELSASFTVPDLPGAFYALGVCNDPCSISGFREPLTGEISIVQTAREAELLNERQDLSGQIYGLKRDMRKLQGANEDLSSRLQGSGLRQSELGAEVTRLRSALARADGGSSAFPAWFALALVGAVLIGAVGGLSWQRRRTSARDVHVMVGRPEDADRPTVGSFR